MKLSRRITLERIGWTGDFNKFREVYHELTLEDLKLLYRIWLVKYPEQSYFDSMFFLSCIEKVKHELGRNPKIVELGGYDGKLAYEILKKHSGINWLNIEIIRHDVNVVPELKNYDYTEHVLFNAKQVYDEKLDLSGFDVFISSDTIEHLSNNELIKLYNYLVETNIKYLMLKINVYQNGQSWEGYGGTHLLTFGVNQLKKIFKEHYEMVEEKDSEPHFGWDSFWIKDEGK